MAELSSSKVYGDLAVNGSIAEGSITLSNKYAPYSTTSSAGRFDATTTAPTDTTTRINFNGYLYATKVFSPAYGDLAEFFEGDEQVEPGDVIIVNPNGNGFIKSQKSYDKLVVGVYSDTYGYVLNGSGGDELNNRIPVGISGRIKVKATGTVSKGDLLVSSDIPGVAMVAENYIPGTAIGKALENHIGDNVDRIWMQIMLT